MSLPISPKVKRINSLTAAQRDRFPEWVAKWIAIGLSTAPADRPRAEAAIRAYYRAAKLPEPKRIAWTSSPLAGAFAFPAAALILEAERRHNGESVDASVRASVGDLVRALVTDSVRASVADSVAESVSDSVGRLVGASVGSSDPKVLAAYRAVLSQTYYRYMGGQFWVGYGWYGYWTSPSMLSYFRDVCGLDFGDKTEIVDAIIALGESCCWWWPHKEFAMASDRPAAIHRDERGRLHNESGHAIAFRDGTGVYSWHGVRVPAEIIIHPENITPKHIDDERNAEVRRVMLERFTLARYVTEGGAEVLHEDEHTARVPEWDETGKNPKLVAVREFKTPRRLLRKQLPEGDLLMIQLTNSSPEPDGTHKQYLLCCHPQLRPMPRRKGGPFGEPQKLTCHNAVASLVGMRGEDYSPDLES